VVNVGKQVSRLFSEK